MKLSVLVTELIDIWKNHGDVEVNVDLLTENQSNITKITDVYYHGGKVSIDCEVDNLKEFKSHLR